MKKLGPVAAPILLLVVACGDATSPQRSDSSSSTAKSAFDQVVASPSAGEKEQVPTPIPDDVTYTVMHQDVVRGIKRSLDVRLNSKVSEQVLASIAMELKKSDPNSYDRTFIGYYLPTMETNAGYWATSHFNPDLEVRILGLTAEQEAALTSQVADSSRQVVGNWLDERPFVANRITIYLQDGKLQMENAYKDGSVGKMELTENESPRGRRFDEVGGSSTGDHWILDSDGKLELRDNEGLIAIARRID